MVELAQQDGAYSTAEADLIERLSSEEQDWGYLPACMRFKQALVRGVGVERAFSICQRVLRVPQLDVLKERPIRALSDFARNRGISYQELWPGGEPFTHPQPRIFGTPRAEETPFTGKSRTGYLACLKDVLVRGRSSVLLAEGDALVDFEGDDLRSFPDNPEYDPSILSATNGTFVMMEPSGDVMDVEEAFLLSGSHTVDFGHWMMEYFPRLGQALSAGWPNVPVLIDQQTPAAVRRALELSLPAGTRFITVPKHAPCRVKKLWVTGHCAYSCFYPTEWSAKTWVGQAMDCPRLARMLVLFKERLMAGRTERCAPPSSDSLGTDPKVFLARSPRLHKKRLVNREEIERIAREHAFRVLHPEEFALAEQASIAHGAEFIVAPEGSNTFVALFARPGTKLLILSNAEVFPLIDCAALFAAVGLDVAIYAGPRASGDEDWPFWHHYSIDPNHFRTLLDAQWPASIPAHDEQVTPVVA